MSAYSTILSPSLHPSPSQLLSSLARDEEHLVPEVFLPDPSSALAESYCLDLDRFGRCRSDDPLSVPPPCCACAPETSLAVVAYLFDRAGRGRRPNEEARTNSSSSSEVDNGILLLDRGDGEGGAYCGILTDSEGRGSFLLDEEEVEVPWWTLPLDNPRGGSLLSDEVVLSKRESELVLCMLSSMA